MFYLCLNYLPMNTGRSLKFRMTPTSTVPQVRHPEVSWERPPGCHPQVSFTKRAVMQESFDFLEHFLHPMEDRASPEGRMKHCSSTDAVSTAHSTTARGLRNLGLSFLSLGKYHVPKWLACLSWPSIPPLYQASFCPMEKLQNPSSVINWEPSKLLMWMENSWCYNLHNEDNYILQEIGVARWL